MEKLENSVWMFGKPEPENGCELIKNCECCLSQILFLEDGICIVMNPCFEGGETYTKGRYRLNGTELSIETADWTLLKKTIWDPSIDPSADPIIDIKKRSVDRESTYYGLMDCNGNQILMDIRDSNSSTGIKQVFPTASQFFQLLKREGVWDLLMSNAERVTQEK